MVMNSDHLKLIRKPFETRPLMLKDYLLDDLSSCSSSGFKSFPRQQCCSAIPFLVDVDLAKSRQLREIAKKPLQRSRSKKMASSTIDALHRASIAVINAVKLLPFPSLKPPATAANRKGLLPRSISRKLCRWRRVGDHKEEKEIKRLKSFGEYLEEKDQPSDRAACDAVAVVVPNRVSTGSSSNSNSCWDGSGSDITSETFGSSSGNSETSSENVVVGVEKTVLPFEKEESSNNRVGMSRMTDGEDSPVTATTSSDDTGRVWPNPEKEQFSPISVLDCPFEDDEEITSPFPCSKQKLRPKIRPFQDLSNLGLEPLDLDKIIPLSNHGDSTAKPADNEETNGQEKAEQLLKVIKTRNPAETSEFKADNLLLDFFTESGKASDDELLKVAQDWVSGKPQELYLGWEVTQGRKNHLKDMEREERWRKVDEEREEVVQGLEVDVWACLVEDLVRDLLC